MAERGQTQGFVLYKQPFGDNDLILHIMTLAFGTVTAFAARARNSRKRFPHQFSPHHYYDMTLVRRSGEMFNLIRCDVKKAFHHISSSLEKIVLLSYFLEVIKEAAPKEEMNKPLFHFLIDLYLYIENHELSDPTVQDLMSLFEMRLLRILGLEPQLTRCLVCHRSLNGRADDDLSLLFSYGLGGVVHKRCGDETAKQGGASISISFQTVQNLAQGLTVDDRKWREASAMAGPSQQLFGAIRFSSNARREARRILPEFLEYHLGKPIKSRRFLSDIF